MSFTWVGGVCIGLLLIGFLTGCQRGFLKALVSVLLMGASFAAVWFINPYVRDFLDEHTKIQSTIESGCREFVEKKLSNAVQNGGKILADKTSSGVSSLIGTLELPGLLEEQLEKTDSVAEAAEKLAEDVEDISSYEMSSVAYSISEKLADIAMSCLSFLVTFFLVSILIRILTFAVSLFSKIPVISGINRLAGGFLGTGEFLVIIWLVMMTATLLCNLEAGQKALELIHADTIADTLYRWNPIIRFFEGFPLK